MFRSQASRKRAGVVGGVALGVALLAGGAVACGGGGSTTPNSAPSADGFAAYTTCLSDHGVKLPTAFASGRPSGFPSGRPSVRPSRSPGEGPGGGGFGGGGLFGSNPPAGVDAATWQAAQQACASVRPTGGASRGAGNNSAFVAYRNCLSEHGVTAGANTANTADPTVAAALKACEPLRPSGPPRPSPTG